MRFPLRRPARPAARVRDRKHNPVLCLARRDASSRSSFRWCRRKIGCSRSQAGDGRTRRHGARDGPWRRQGHGGYGARHAQQVYRQPRFWPADLCAVANGSGPSPSETDVRTQSRPDPVPACQRRDPLSGLALRGRRDPRASERCAEYGGARPVERRHRLSVQRGVDIPVQGPAILRGFRGPAHLHSARPLAGDARSRRRVPGNPRAHGSGAAHGDRAARRKGRRSADRRGAGRRCCADPAGQQDSRRRRNPRRQI